MRKKIALIGGGQIGQILAMLAAQKELGDIVILDRVLRLLTTTSLSSSEIADELVVSIHTVRSHIKNIYAKLNIHTRYEAIEKAKALSLI